MNQKVVFFGGPDYGKSTLIGYIYANIHGINMNTVEKQLRKELGTKYMPDYLYQSLVNPHVAESIRRNERANSKTHEIKNVEIDYLGPPIKFALIDTPGHTKYYSGRQLGISMSDIGVFCLAIEKVLSDDFTGATFVYSNLYSQYHPNGKLIYLLTMYDLVNYSEEDYLTATEKIKQYCRWVDVTKIERVLGSDMPYSINELDSAAIIPVAVEFKTEAKEGINIFSRSEKTPWYEGMTLVEAMRDQVRELRMCYA